jgi:hypothetical protein
MEYRIPFENWDAYSTVHKPLPDYTFESGLVPFPPELVSGVGHMLVDKLGKPRRTPAGNAQTGELQRVY